MCARFRKAHATDHKSVGNDLRPWDLSGFGYLPASANHGLAKRRAENFCPLRRNVCCNDCSFPRRLLDLGVLRPEVQPLTPFAPYTPLQPGAKQVDRQNHRLSADNTFSKPRKPSPGPPHHHASTAKI